MGYKDQPLESHKYRLKIIFPKDRLSAKYISGNHTSWSLTFCIVNFLQLYLYYIFTISKMSEADIHRNHSRACNFIKKDTPAQVFSCEYCEIFKNRFFIEHFWWLLLKCQNWSGLRFDDAIISIFPIFKICNRGISSFVYMKEKFGSFSTFLQIICEFCISCVYPFCKQNVRPGKSSYYEADLGQTNSAYLWKAERWKYSLFPNT